LSIPWAGHYVFIAAMIQISSYGAMEKLVSVDSRPCT
jgi:hypothetical protein